MTKRVDRTISPARATLLSLPLAVALAGAVLFPFLLLWGSNPLQALRAVAPLTLLAVFIVSVALHELVHALGWYLASSMPRPHIKFGINWRVLMPYAHATQPLCARTYRLGVVAPGLLLGALPAIVGLSVGSVTLAMWAAAMLAIAAGDLLVIASLWGVPPIALVKDHPTRVGCEVVEDDAEAA
jgi:hypothetical protein